MLTVSSQEMALLEQTSPDLHFMTVENRIFIRRSQTERVTIVLEDCFFFLNTSHISFMPKATMGLPEAQRHSSHSRGEGEEEGEAIVGTGPMSGAVEECRHVQQ